MQTLTDAIIKTRPAHVMVLDDEPECFTTTNAPAVNAKTSPADGTKETIFEAFRRSLVTSEGLRAQVLPKRKKLLGDFLCEGDLGFVYAARGVGKTWLGQGMAQAIASGTAFGPWGAGEGPSPVLYIDCEMPAELSQDRDKGLADVVTNGEPADLMYLHHDLLFERTGKTMNFASPEMQQAITRLCIEQDRKVVILDNLSTGIRGVRENEGFDWEGIQSWLLDLRHLGIAVVILAHAGRNGEMRGASKREDPASWIIKLTDAKDAADRGACFVSHFSKPSRNAPHGVADVEWSFETKGDGTLIVTHKKAEASDRFRSLIEGGVNTCSDLADLLEVTPGTISKWAAKAEKEGWLERNGRMYKIKS